MRYSFLENLRALSCFSAEMHQLINRPTTRASQPTNRDTHLASCVWIITRSCPTTTTQCLQCPLFRSVFYRSNVVVVTRSALCDLRRQCTVFGSANNPGPSSSHRRSVIPPRRVQRFAAQSHLSYSIYIVVSGRRTNNDSLIRNLGLHYGTFPLGFGQSPDPAQPKCIVLRCPGMCAYAMMSEAMDMRLEMCLFYPGWYSIFSTFYDIFDQKYCSLLSMTQVNY